MKTVSHSAAVFPSSQCTELHHFICVSAVAAACLKMFLLKGKIQLHYKVIKCLLQSMVTFSRREVTKFS